MLPKSLSCLRRLPAGLQDCRPSLSKFWRSVRNKRAAPESRPVTLIHYCQDRPLSKMDWAAILLMIFSALRSGVSETGYGPVPEALK